MEGKENLSCRKHFHAILLLLIFISCAPKTSPPESNIPKGAVPVTVIDFRELDGCTFLLQMENGDKLQPENLPADFQKPGLKLFITYKYNDGMGICMAGKMITLIEVVESKPSKP